MIHAESAEQRAYFDWARYHAGAKVAFAIPNGGRRNRIEAARMKGEGVTAGVLDVMLPRARGGAHGLWLEFKAGRNTLTKSQAERADQLVADGYAVAVVYSALAAIRVTLDYLDGRIGACMLVIR